MVSSRHERSECLKRVPYTEGCYVCIYLMIMSDVLIEPVVHSLDELSEVSVVTPGYVKFIEIKTQSHGCKIDLLLLTILTVPLVFRLRKYSICILRFGAENWKIHRLRVCKNLKFCNWYGSITWRMMSLEMSFTKRFGNFCSSSSQVTEIGHISLNIDPTGIISSSLDPHGR